MTLSRGHTSGLTCYFPQVVRLYIRPATAQVKTCYAEALVTGQVSREPKRLLFAAQPSCHAAEPPTLGLSVVTQVPPKHLFPWCTSATVVDLDGVSQQVCACSTLFGGSRRGGAGLGAGESGAGDAALDRVVLGARSQGTRCHGQEPSNLDGSCRTKVFLTNASVVLRVGVRFHGVFFIPRLELPLLSAGGAVGPALLLAVGLKMRSAFPARV